MPNIVNIVVTAKDGTKPAFDSAGGGLAKLGKLGLEAGVAIGAALTDIAVKSVKMAMNFDAEMTRLTTQAGVAKNQLGVLSRGVLDLAGQVGQSPDSLAEALFHVESNFASLGISSQKALSLVKIAAEGASVGGANLVDVTNALTAAVASGIPGVEDFSKAMGILNATVGAGDMTMQDLSNALSSGVLAVVKGYGLSIKDVSAALATFGDNNIRGKVAATDLRTAVQALAVPAKDGKAQLLDWGVAADGLAKDMQKGGLLFALEHLQQLFKANGITATQQGDIITQMFGKKAGSGLAILLSQMDRLKSKYPDLTKGADQFGQAWATTTETVKQKWNDLTNGIKAKMIDLGNWMISQGDRLVPKIDKQLPEIKRLFDEAKRVIGEVFAVAAPFFKERWGKIVDDFKSLAKEVKQDWPEIKTYIGAVAVVVAGLIEILLTLFDWVVKGETILVRAFKIIMDSAIIAFREMVDGAAKAFGWIPGLGPELKKAAKNVDDFADRTLNALDRIPKTITVTVNTVSNLQGTYNQQVPYAARHAIGGIAGGLTMVGERGIELINLPNGTHVTPNGSVGGTLAGAMASGGRQMNAQLVMTVSPGADTAIGSMIMRLMRQGHIVIKPHYVRG